MPLRTRRSGRLEKTDAEKPSRNVLGGIENVLAESPARTRSSVKAKKKRHLATSTPSQETRKEVLELGVSPIGEPVCQRASRNTRGRPEKVSPAHFTTSTPDSTPSQSVPPVADLEEQSPWERVSLSDSTDLSQSLFDTAMESPGMHHMSGRPRRRRGQDQSQSPMLTVKKVKRTYSRGSRLPSLSVNLFEEAETPAKVDLYESFDKLETEREDKLETEREVRQKKTRAPLKPKARKQRKQDEAFEEWADKMAAEFEEIEKFELCVE
ncbi:uncharacterized protein LOC144133463 [Amblyomma americanum]